MTDLDQLVHTLPMQAKITLVQVRQDPMLAVPAAIPSALSMLLHHSLVNVRDGHLAVSRRGMEMLRVMDTDRQIETCDRFLRIVGNVLGCVGEVRGLEQAFSAPNFTVDELDVLIERMTQVLGALERAKED